MLLKKACPDLLHPAGRRRKCTAYSILPAFFCSVSTAQYSNNVRQAVFNELPGSVWARTNSGGNRRSMLSMKRRYSDGSWSYACL